jgi:hypothetical protein
MGRSCVGNVGIVRLLACEGPGCTRSNSMAVGRLYHQNMQAMLLEAKRSLTESWPAEHAQLTLVCRMIMQGYDIIV